MKYYFIFLQFWSSLKLGRCPSAQIGVNSSKLFLTIYSGLVHSYTNSNCCFQKTLLEIKIQHYFILLLVCLGSSRQIAHSTLNPSTSDSMQNCFHIPKLSETYKDSFDMALIKHSRIVKNRHYSFTPSQPSLKTRASHM